MPCRGRTSIRFRSSRLSMSCVRWPATWSARIDRTVLPSATIRQRQPRRSGLPRSARPAAFAAVARHDPEHGAFVAAVPQACRRYSGAKCMLAARMTGYWRDYLRDDEMPRIRSPADAREACRAAAGISAIAEYDMLASRLWRWPPSAPRECPRTMSSIPARRTASSRRSRFGGQRPALADTAASLRPPAFLGRSDTPPAPWPEPDGLSPATNAPALRAWD